MSLGRAVTGSHQYHVPAVLAGFHGDVLAHEYECNHAKSGRLFNRALDTYAGAVEEPITLHKYMYGNLDPVYHIDPSGKISIGGAFAATGITSTLTSVGITSFDLTSLFISGGSDVSARDVGGG